ncbi:UDP-N-acetylmuramoyl-tripeptide--D-alanyl-D-alanine ligase [Butyrivibrio sp. INlla16]|uniref:Mur ligase family protein n=1 Tax=Butyrivibrio sp. INlla16 TaxID=1520807 RepID=UPI000890BE91|nr:UDP-N-acetylmuramoyl-tripeptide--D-alanyl-D-alanine ligase [Butyrivibrio sp. INlla16]SDB64865.1 UDP-N-acetylmuramoyl-tripeptide--D-alanyl-D-alanine ligase [Butyrivibrio sp. INlla16]
MNTFLLILYFAAYIAVTVLGLRYYTHMLQLSSYQFQGYFRFLRSKPHRYGLHVGFLCVTIIGGMLGSNKLGSAFRILSLLFLIFLIFQYIPKPAKKKFVVTKRVQRLFVTYAVLFLILGVIAVYLYFTGGQTISSIFIATSKSVSNFTVEGSKKRIAAGIIFASFVGLLPLVTALCNLINKPIEKRVNDWFIHDAQRMLQEHPGLRIIGITGSYGKTSVKYYLWTLLSEGFRVLMTPESFNTPMGVVRTIREQLTPMHEIFICEMGARHVHDIKEITDIVHPDDGILTSIGPQHLETFHSIENIIDTKYELFDAVQEKSRQGLKFANGDNELIRNNMRHENVVLYGVSEGCDYRATEVKYSPDGASFKVTAPNGEEAEFSMKLLGEHNVTNVVGAIAMAHTMGIPMTKLKMAVRRITPAPHRQELLKHGNVSIIDDAYNSNPMGAKMALDTLSKFEGSVRILVTPGMVELGEKEAEYNKEFGRQAADAADYIILVGADHVKPIKEGALEAGFSEDRLFVKTTLKEATDLMYEIDAGKPKVILLENDLPDNYT